MDISKKIFDIIKVINRNSHESIYIIISLVRYSTIAIWLLPTKWVYGSWPTSGEMDIMETRGNSQLFINNVNIGIVQTGSTLHWGPNSENNRFMRTHYEQNSDVGYNEGFHKYQVEWTDDYIKFSVDDTEIGKIIPPSGGFWELGDLEASGLPNPWKNGTKMAPFDDEFHLILNLAIGGTFFPDEAINNNGKKPWSMWSPTAMTEFWQGNGQWKPTWNLDTDNTHFKVDYVKVWAL